MALYAKIDCGIARDPKMIAAGPHARLLYVQATLFCRENLTDGVVEELVLPIVALDIPTPKKHMQRLVALGALEQIDGGWRIPERVWAKYNPTRAEVDARRADEARRKAEWRESRRDAS